MTRLLVAAGFRWDEYPGLRVGKLYSGQGELGRHPRGETHVVAGPNALETLCGLPRSAFPHDFTEPVRLTDSDPCNTCQIDGPSQYRTEQPGT